MGFADRFVRSLTSHDLRDDAFHHDLDAIAAAALAGDLGSLLSRVKYADGTVSKLFEGNSNNLAQLVRIWTLEVIKKGRERKWVKEGTAWDAAAAQALYRRVAERSLAHWLAGHCDDCRGAGVTRERRLCPTCKGSGQADVFAGGFERERILDMIGELQNVMISHNSRASGRLRAEC
ncbi:hypothetical protein [Rugamonas sp.]|uniref:hypothetical protein n=1 Tax=Rugamonas sp. TaxID=1926287 RepID=UPI0025E88707|nr:hypothetical protein [Rugamonas sp.]